MREVMIKSFRARRDRPPLLALQFRTILVQARRGHHSAAL
eukprot:COSAG02_NODE_1288_length_13447_cov_17.387549_8_plen_40_part_00